MKKITLLTFLMIFSFGYSQDLLLGFEAGESGGATGSFGGCPTPIVEAGTGTNTSQVLKIVGNPAGEPWQGIDLNLTTSVNLTATQTMTMDVFSDTPATFLVKVKGGLTGPAIVAASATHTGGSTWQTISFTFNTALDGQAALATGVYTGFVIHTYWAPGATTFFNPTVPTPARTLYVDNISGPSGVPPVVAAPTAAAPTPTVNAANVISMFSNAYTNVAVDTWKTPWSNATLEEIQIQGNDTKKYSALDFVGIETVGANSIDASDMTTLHFDMWSPNVTTFRIKLVDWGANNAFQGGDDSEHEIVITNPALGQWVSLSIPLTDFTGLTAREHISQMILSCLPTAQGIVYVDNVFFSVTAQAPNVPLTAAPTPTIDAANVISMFSNAYTNVTVDTWKTAWSNATLEDIQIQGNDTKKYSALDFVGIETVGANAIDASDMTTLNFDMWSPNVTTFRIKLVDFGANNAFGGGDDSEHEIVITNPTLGEWVSLSIPLSDFTGLTAREHISQMILSCLPTAQGIVYVDNVFFSTSAQAPTEPMTAAPTPTYPEVNVISMFSNAYTNVAVDTWKTAWSNATLTDIQIQGNDTKKYTALDFVGIETVGANSIDASDMTIFHLDMWSPNVTTFRVKLVDFGANNAFQGGDDSEHEIVITNPALGEWVSLAIPLSDFTGLTAREHISQLILSCLPTAQGTVFVDNVYFSNGIFSNDSFERVNVALYPNPTQGTLFLSASSEVTAYEIYNITGQRIMSGNVNATQIEINTSNLQSGIYLIKTEVNGQVNTQKFVKN